MDELIAHEAPMILIDQVLGFNETQVKCQVVITEETPFMTNNVVPSYVSIEYMAQSIACHSGILALNSGRKIDIGFLLGTRRLILSKNEFVIGDVLVVDAENLYKDGEMAAFECKISLREEIVATANLNVYQPREFQAES